MQFATLGSSLSLRPLVGHLSDWRALQPAANTETRQSSKGVEGAVGSVSLDEARLLMQVARDASLGVTFGERFGALSEGLLSLVPGVALGAMVLNSEPGPPGLAHFQNNDPANLALYAQHYVHVDPMGHGIAEATGRPLLLSDCVAPGRFGADEFTDFLANQSVRHIMGLAVKLPDGYRLALTIQRASSQGNFSTQERRLIELVTPDLARAAFGTLLRKQLAELAAAQGGDGASAPRSGGLIVGSQGQLRHVDPGALAILRDQAEFVSLDALVRDAGEVCAAAEGASAERLWPLGGAGALRVVISALAGEEAMVVLEVLGSEQDSFEEISERACLTPRERQVARLAVEGLGNQGIAYQLKISPVTVGVHLGKVYRKVGVSGRTELARAMSLPLGA